MDFNAFRTYVFTIDSVGLSGLDQGFIRAKNQVDGFTYEFKANNRDLDLADKYPDRYSVIVSSSNISGARIADLTKAVGTSNIQPIVCTLISQGTVTHPQMANIHVAADNPSRSPMHTIVYDEVPGAPSKDYNPEDKEARRQAGVSCPGILASTDLLVIKGIGKGAISLTSQAQFVVGSESTIYATQEDDRGGALFTTSYNFLQHYFIGLGNAVALPMPHMINFTKMASVCKFMKSIINTTKIASQGLREV
jgi:hypothetical protein